MYHRGMRKILTASLLLFMLPLAAAGLEPPVSLQELDGEVLKFVVEWSGIPAAEATLCAEKLPGDRMRFTNHSKSYPAVALVYPLNSKIESEVELPSVQPLLYEKKGREGWGKQYERRVDFNYKTGKSQYYRNAELRRTLDIKPGIQDPLSCFYYFRTALLPKDEPFHFKVTDGATIVDSNVKVLRREKVTVPAGTFSTVVIQPNMEGVGGVFAKSPGSVLLMWITDDKWRRPVKMYSKVKVGSFTAELESLGTSGGCFQERKQVVESFPAPEQ